MVNVKNFRWVKIRRPYYRVLTFEKSLTVAVFLGGITLGVLTFLFQVEETTFITKDAQSEGYKEMLIFVAGIAESLLIMSVFGIKVVLVDKRKGNEVFSIVALYTYEAGFGALVILLPILVYAFSQTGAYIIIGIIGGWGVIFCVYKILNHLKPSFNLDYY